MTDLLATLKHVRFLLFGDASGPGPNAPVIRDTLWADTAETLQDYIDDAIERAGTLPLPGFTTRMHAFESDAKYPQFCAHCAYPPGAMLHFAQAEHVSTPVTHEEDGAR